MLYTRGEMKAAEDKAEELSGVVTSLQDFLLGIGATKDDRGLWRFSWPDKVAALRGEVLDERARADGLRRELESLGTSAEEARRDRDSAERALLGAGWSRPLMPDGSNAPWTAPRAGEARASAHTVSRHPDPLTPAAAAARTVALPVLDAVALLAVIDAGSLPPGRGAEALGGLEQAVEAWLDARTGGA